ncbi:MAG TPA: CHAT domain-containing protein [Pyrinomonadaceae bacterium]|nr:CHAT domain-containing protein [Pyrinomonadaceae bacterium]
MRSNSSLFEITLAALGLLLTFQFRAIGQEQPVAPAEIKFSDCGSDIRPIPREQSASITSKIAPGQVQCYRLSLEKNQYAHVDVVQRGVDVVVQLFNSSGIKIGPQIDSTNYRDGPEPISLVSNADTDCVIAVRSQDKPSDREPLYDVRVTELRQANDADTNYVEAERAFYQSQLQLQSPKPDMAGAISNLERAYSLLKTFSSKPQIWPQILDQLGDAYSTVGKFFEAVNAYEELSNFSIDKKNFDKAADALTSIGMLYFNTGQPAVSRNYYERALSVGATDTEVLANANYNLGVALEALAQYQLALDKLLEAKRLYEAGRKQGPTGEDKFQEAFPHFSKGIGLAYAHLGDHVTAMEFYREGLAVAEPNGQPPNRVAADAAAYLHLYKGFSAFQQNDKATGEKETTIAFDLFQRLGNNPAAANALVNTGSVYYDVGDFDQALTLLNRAEAMQAHDPIGLAYTKTNIGRILIDQGHPTEALRILSDALKLRGGDKSGEAITLYAMALGHIHLKELNTAFGEIDRARTIVEDIQKNIISPDQRSLFRGSVDKIYKLYTDILMRQGRTSEALEFEDNAQALGLREALLSARINFARTLAGGPATDAQTLTNEISRFAGKRQLLGPDLQKSSQAVELNRQIDERTARLRAIEQETLSDPTAASLLKPAPLTIQQIVDMLDSETTLIEYSLGEEQSYVWAVSKGEDPAIVSGVLPGRKKVEQLATQVKDLMGKADLDQEDLRRYQQVSREFSSMLLSGVKTAIAGKRLVVVADGILQYTPFSGLPEPDVASDWQPLVVQHEIVNIPSASALAAVRQETMKRPIPSQTIALFADPIYVRSKTGGRSDATSAKGGKILRPLAFAKDEIDGIESAFAKLGPGRELVPFKTYDATRQNGTSVKLQSFRIIHYSAHGVADDARPEASGIYLSSYDRQGREIPNFMGLSDIYNLKLSADLVVLSACETALGKQVPGEGIVGLTRGFMHAGSASVVSSLWEANEFHTARLMRDFYDGMFDKKQSPAAALRAAQREMWRQKLPPYYWASFNLYGDWRLKQPF